MRQHLEKVLLKLFSAYMGKKAVEAELLPKYKITSCQPLSKNEKATIHSKWRELCTVKDFRSWEFYKEMIGFNPYFVPDDIFVRYIIRVLNPIDKVYCLQNKSMYPFLYSHLNMPETHAVCIKGVIYRPDGEITSLKQLSEQLSFDHYYIIKPSTDSCSGQGVVKIHSLKDLANAINSIGNNFVIQDCIEQSSITNRFNKSSLNTFRINTLYLNGRISTINIMFRHGLNGAIVDNAGAGGVYSGMSTDGRFIGCSLDRHLNKYIHTPFGEKYSEIVIPELKALTQYAENAHKTFLPMMGHIAWDIALDKANNPIVVEINLGWPGIITEQLSSCRPIYGDRSEEVIKYVTDRQNQLAFTDFLEHWT